MESVEQAEPLIVAEQLARRFRMGDSDVLALRGVSFTIERGEHVAIVGPSGSGKSTLMCLLGCFDTPTSGSYRIGGQDVSKLGDSELARLRNAMIGFVFQAFHLLPRTSSLDNVALPLRYRGVSRRARRALAHDALTRVGLGHREEHPPDRLSGGERQRVAIARAIVTSPPLLLCDEPTGNLDQRVGGEISDLFEQLNRDTGVTLVTVTHDPSLARRARRVLGLVDGELTYDGPPERLQGSVSVIQ